MFIADLADASVGSEVVVTGAEAHHAHVMRIATGEQILLSDGEGRGAAATVTSAAKTELKAQVTQLAPAPAAAREFVVVQALPKRDRGELAVQAATELGAARILGWQAARSIAKATGERGEKLQRKWQATALASAKQCRLLRVPEVIAPVSTKQVAEVVSEAAAAFVLHEAATESLARLPLPETGEIVIVIGPEGGISEAELAEFQAAGAMLGLISSNVLRTSTATAVALAQLQLDVETPWAAKVQRHG